MYKMATKLNYVRLLKKVPPNVDGNPSIYHDQHDCWLIMLIRRLINYHVKPYVFPIKYFSNTYTIHFILCVNHFFTLLNLASM